jgi:hypothetical protein
VALVKFLPSFLIGLALAHPWTLQAQTRAPTEHQVQIAFLYNFAKFVEWPPDAFQDSDSRFTLCIAGADPFGKELEENLDGKTIQDKKLVLKRIADPAEAQSCQVLFISASEEARLNDFLGPVGRSPVLTVSDMDHFIQRGGIVGFTLEQRRVRFNVNLRAADHAGLKMSSELLKLAKTVLGKTAVESE